MTVRVRPLDGVYAQSRSTVWSRSTVMKKTSVESCVQVKKGSTYSVSAGSGMVALTALCRRRR